jgi:glycosyltransferase involved in cell wall biosynthesis
MNIAIISIYPFPDGMAPTNRIIAYSKGLIANGAVVTVFVPFPTDKWGTQKKNQGEYQGVNYLYTGFRCKSKYRHLRGISVYLGFRKVYGLITAFWKIYYLNGKKKFDFIIISSDSPLIIFIFSLLSRKIKAKSFFIFDEYPVPIRHRLKEKIPKIKEKIYSIVLKNINGYISISEKLKDYYCRLMQKRTFIMSAIVDDSRFFQELLTDDSSDEYLCYMGNMELEKDNVELIIKAFFDIHTEYPNLKLFLFGSPKERNLEKIKKLICQNGLTDKVILKGKVSADEVPDILKRAKILVSSQPNTKRASGGFPTKLGEYLLANVPTLLTDVGENSKYIKNNVHAFFAKPESISDYADKLSFILNNYKSARKIASNGRDLILQNYTHEIVGKNLLLFINTEDD